MKHFYLIFLFAILYLLQINSVKSQCGPNVPTFTADLTGSVDSAWVSPPVIRNDNCCGTSSPDRCVRFIITLDPGSVGINFELLSGAVPGGALYYQIDCGPITPVGSPICLNGVGPHSLTFCKPGNNENVYGITALPAPAPPSSQVINDGCNGILTATGYIESTVTWTSVSPGATGAYNNYLSCTSGCLSTNVTGLAGAPPSVDYQVCGLPLGGCITTPVCFTATITFNPTLFAAIEPLNPTVCFGQTGTTITANGIGGSPPYNYTWNTGDTTQSIYVGPGTYSVVVGDTSGCPPTSASVVVTEFTSTIESNAGPDIIVCAQNPVATLNGSIQAASGGIWNGGSGIFNPDNTTLNATYTPTATEIANGSVTLTLVTTGNGTCPADSDQVVINIVNFQGNIVINASNVSCNGSGDGSLIADVTGTITPYSFSWNTNPVQTTQTATGLAPGSYEVTVTDGNGCYTTTTGVITEPDTLTQTAVITNVSCYLGSNGSISVTPYGGTPPYTYLWQHNGSNLSSVGSLQAGTYSVTITDANGCVITPTYTITQPPIITAIISDKGNVNCYGGTDGWATVAVSGGTPSYSYSWSSSGGSAPTANGLIAGSYVITVTDANGCQGIANVIINQPTDSIMVTSSVVNVSCFNGNDGSISLSVQGGTSPYTYLWSNSGTASSISDLTAGNYSVTVTDANGCTFIINETVTEPLELIALEGIITNVSCFGGNDGSASVVVNGGTAPYSYSWSSGGNANIETGLIAGTYTVTVTDANGCTDQVTSIIEEPLQALSLQSTQTEVSCFEGEDGTAQVIVTGGTSSYYYNWSPSVSLTDSASSLIAGVYTVIVTDNNGCEETIVITITEPTPIALTVIENNVSCNAGSDGSATVNASGGTPGYFYSWSSGGTAATESGLTAGTYSVTVTDENGCQIDTIAEITQPVLLEGVIVSSNVLCNGGNSGEATLNLTGGTPAYSYLWSDSQTGQTATGLIAGTYSVTGTDDNGCEVTLNVTITEPDTLELSTIVTDVNCFGETNGSIEAIVSGGTGTISYSWSNGGTSSIESNLAAGTYIITVTDQNNCVATETVIVPEPDLLTVVINSTDVNCFNGSDGTATAVPIGGNGIYFYEWTPGGATSSTITGLIAGTYSVTVTDNKGCTVSSSVIIDQPVNPLTAVFNVTNVSCNGGSDGAALVIPSGGTAPFSYSWSNGATTDQISGVIAGVYTVTITDANGCVLIENVTITEPTILTAVAGSVSNVSCFGGNNGSASVSVSSGTSGYTYSWSPTGGTGAIANNLAADNYTVTVTDANGCIETVNITVAQPTAPLAGTISSTPATCYGGNDGSVTVTPSGGTSPYYFQWVPGGATTASVSNLVAGTYTVYVTDENNCTYTDQVVVGEGVEIVLTTSVVDATCNTNNGEASVSASGGVPGYTYSWSPSGDLTSSITNIGAGAHVVTVTDAVGCTQQATALLNNFAGPSAVVYETQNVTCHGGTDGYAIVGQIGGTPPYTYSWNTNPVQTDTIATGLSAGVYTITVTDANGCQGLANTDPEITQPPPFQVVTSKTNVSCNGGNDGTATVTASGNSPATGSSPYSYIWSPYGGTDSIATGLSAGTYTVTIADSNNCDTTVTIIISEPTLMTATATVNSHILCYGGNNGSVSVVASGGTPGYSYEWTPGGATSANVTGLTAGSYTATVTDAKGCIVSSTTAIITEPAAPLSATHTVSNVSCFGGSNGSATVNASGGTPGYTYFWSNNDINQTTSGLTAGSYSVTVTDNNGCTTSNNVNISQPTELSVAIGNTTNVSCFGGSNGTASVVVSGGTSAYSYSWNTSGSTSSYASGLAAGNHTVTVTDANGCSDQATAVITQPASALTVSISAQTNVACMGGNTGSASVFASGGTMPYTYFWSPSVSSGNTASNLSAGSYTVTVTDFNGCQAVQNITITEPTSLVFASLTSTDVSCNGGNNGTATAIPNGGTPGYTYSWSPVPGSSSSISGLTAGTYTVTVTDANGCQISGSTAVTQPSALSATISKQNVLCYNGSNGSATINVSGGTSGYTYLWSPGGQTGSTAGGLIAGTYSVTATDANGCQITKSVTITQPTQLNSSITKNDVICYGQANGNATATVSGGVSPYSYNWSPSGGTSATASNLIAGTYMITVTDVNGCVVQSNITINQPDPLTSSINATAVSCFGGANGSVSVSALGGNGGYTYFWNPSGQTSQTASGLIAGTYTVTITDYKGCQANNSATVTQPVSALTASITKSNVSCFGGNNGSATVNASGGTAPYTYLWSNSNTNQTAIGLTAGNYSVVVTDVNGCSYTETNVNITQPTLLEASIINYDDAYCLLGDGKAYAYVTGGESPYSYNWSPSGGNDINAFNLSPDTYTFIVRDANGCQSSAQVTISSVPGFTAAISSSTDVSCFAGNDGTATVTPQNGFTPYVYSWAPSGNTSATATGLYAGTHTVTITDAKGCQFTTSVIINQPQILTASITTSSSVNCFGGSNGMASVSASGGIPSYTYSWNSTPVQNTATATNLPAGSYTVIVTDQNGCTRNVNTTITQPSQLNAAVASFTNVSCFGGSNGTAKGQGSGGTPPYSYSWNSVPAQTTQTASNLPIGTYTVTITDNKGCLATEQVTITQPTPVVTVVSPDTSICKGSSTTIWASGSGGGTGGYFYIWNNGLNTSAAHNVSPQSTTTYTVTAYDNSGCAGNSESVTVTVISLEPEDLKVEGTPLICPGYEGLVYASVANADTSLISYSWSPNTTWQGAGAFVVIPQSPTTYTVTVTNSTCNVQVTESFSIDFKPLPNVQITTGGWDGCVSHAVQFSDVSVSTADPIVSWQWDLGDGTTSTLQNPSNVYETPGTYPITLVATTSGGCSASSSGSSNVVTAYPNPEAAFSATPSVVFIPESVVFKNQSINGNSYLWSFGDGSTSNQENPKHSYGAAGTYTIILTTTTIHGCVDTTSMEVIATGNIQVPTAFTPSSSGPNGGNYDPNSLDNTIFFPYSDGIEDFHMMIFNRWGELIFETFDLKIGWDGYYRGQLCKQDVYVWKINARFNDNRVFSKAGDVTLLR